ncbi:hypothetical protein [Furfurilactobacillus curtus]|uniref:Uncharacterized protein n=1 Tax=Furfurilactobacillus curtus TaxID=1746200 RepID=A0ABQ5JN98_9LACO
MNNSEQFLHDLKTTLRGHVENDQATLKAVTVRLKGSQSGRYEISKWRAKDGLNHEFMFACHDQQVTYLYMH